MLLSSLIIPQIFELAYLTTESPTATLSNRSWVMHIMWKLSFIAFIKTSWLFLCVYFLITCPLNPSGIKWERHFATSSFAGFGFRNSYIQPDKPSNKRNGKYFLSNFNCMLYSGSCPHETQPLPWFVSSRNTTKCGGL